MNLIDEYYNQILTYRALEKARFATCGFNYESAKIELSQAISTIQASSSSSSLVSISMISELQETLSDLESREYSLCSKKMALKSKMISKQKASSSRSKKNEMMARYASLQKPISAAEKQQFIEFKIGNRHQLIPEDQAQVSKSDPSQLHVHKWTAYVECSEKDFIERVEFHLHSTFNEGVVVVSDAPFEVERNGWGVFTLIIDVFFNTTHPANKNGKTHKEFQQLLDFTCNDRNFCYYEDFNN